MRLRLAALWGVAAAAAAAAASGLPVVAVFLYRAYKEPLSMELAVPGVTVATTGDDEGVVERRCCFTGDGCAEPRGVTPARPPPSAAAGAVAAPAAVAAPVSVMSSRLRFLLRGTCSTLLSVMPPPWGTLASVWSPLDPALLPRAVAAAVPTPPAVPVVVGVVGADEDAGSGLQFQ